jgi:hypothetical protein
MAGSSRWAKDAKGWIGWTALMAAIAASPAAAGQAPEQAAVQHLRPTTRAAAAYLEAGKARSATFRELVAAIEQSDLAVYIQALPVGNVGQLQFVSAAGGVRYVWVTVRIQGTDDDVVPILAHELTHAVEIARAPEVRNADSLLRLYERLGRASKSVVSAHFETDNAQRMQGAVAKELRRQTP